VGKSTTLTDALMLPARVNNSIESRVDFVSRPFPGIAVAKYSLPCCFIGRTF
jgi:hypothetical protein